MEEGTCCPFLQFIAGPHNLRLNTTISQHGLTNSETIQTRIHQSSLLLSPLVLQAHNLSEAELFPGLLDLQRERLEVVLEEEGQRYAILQILTILTALLIEAIAEHQFPGLVPD